MDDKTIALFLGRRTERIDDTYLRRAAEQGRLSEHEAGLISRYILHSRGRNRLTNLLRDVQINVAVELLQEQGASFRSACRRVSEHVPLSFSAIVSICQKERQRSV